jgi:hypothetical protein
MFLILTYNKLNSEAGQHCSSSEESKSLEIKAAMQRHFTASRGNSSHHFPEERLKISRKILGWKILFASENPESVIEPN